MAEHVEQPSRDVKAEREDLLSLIVVPLQLRSPAPNCEIIALKTIIRVSHLPDDHL